MYNLPGVTLLPSEHNKVLRNKGMVANHDNFATVFIINDLFINDFNTFGTTRKLMGHQLHISNMPANSIIQDGSVFLNIRTLSNAMDFYVDARMHHSTEDNKGIDVSLLVNDLENPITFKDCMVQEVKISIIRLIGYPIGWNETLVFSPNPYSVGTELEHIKKHSPKLRKTMKQLKRFSYLMED